MFDTYVTRPGRSYHESHTTITEKRAPTDESVRLLSEMEKSAENKLISTTKLEFNGIKAVVTVIDEPWDFNRRCIIRFDINGIEDKLEVPVSRSISDKDGLLKVRDAIAKELATKWIIEGMRTTAIIRP